jgi:hypothetical protein
LKHLLAILSFLLFAACNNTGEQPPKSQQKAAVEGIDDTISSPPKDAGETMKLGYMDTYDRLPKLQFDTISESEFNNKRDKFTLLKPALKSKGNYFFISTNEQQHKFKKYNDYGDDKGYNGYEYVGYYPKLKLFALTENSSSEGLGFGELFLLDSITDYKYKIISFGDGSVTPPIPSPNNKYLVYYDNSVYEQKNCDIGILKINSKTSPENFLKEYAYHHSDQFAIEQLIWVTDNTIFVKGYEEVRENDEWVKKFRYYKATFK